MVEAVAKVGIIACSGEEIAEGTISRLAVRRVLEALRPRETVTLCLPLFLAGDGGERRFAREHPTVTVDGCAKRCAKRGTEEYSGQVSVSLVIADILGDLAQGCHRSARDANKADEEAVWRVAERIAAEVDSIAARGARKESPEAPGAGNRACGCCGGASPEGDVEVAGKRVTINCLPLIFQRLREQGLAPGDRSAESLLETVKIYHAIEPEEEATYRPALVEAYRRYCERRS